MKKGENVYTKYILEVFLVAFGVFLGLFVSEWVAQNKTDKKVKRSLSYIVNELNENYEKVDKAIIYHQHLNEKLDSIQATLSKEAYTTPYFSSKEFRHYLIPGWKGLGIPTLEDIVFESTKIEGIYQELDIATINTISRSYAKQESLNKLGETVQNKFIGINSDTKTVDVIAIIEIITIDVLNNEIRLKDELLKTIDDLKSRQ